MSFKIKKRLNQQALHQDCQRWLTETEKRTARNILIDAAQCGAPLCAIKTPPAVFERLLGAASGGAARPIRPVLFGVPLEPSPEVKQLEGVVEAVPYKEPAAAASPAAQGA